MRSAVDSLRTLIRNAFGTSLCCSLPPAACLPVCAFVLLLTYSLLKSRSLSLSCFVSFSAAVAASAAAASAAWAWHCWLFGDACLFLSSFAPRDDGPAKFCPCFKNCSVLNFVLFGFIIRTHTHTYVHARVQIFRSRRNTKFHVVVTHRQPIDISRFSWTKKRLFIFVLSGSKLLAVCATMTAADLRP